MGVDVRVPEMRVVCGQCAEVLYDLAGGAFKVNGFCCKLCSL